MSPDKIKTEELVEAFQKLGDAYRALQLFVKNNKEHLPKSMVGHLKKTSGELADKQQELIDITFQEIIRKKGKRD